MLNGCILDVFVCHAVFISDTAPKGVLIKMSTLSTLLSSSNVPTGTFTLRFLRNNQKNSENSHLLMPANGTADHPFMPSVLFVGRFSKSFIFIDFFKNKQSCFG